MGKKNCGCGGDTSTTDKAYLMIEATGSEASQCNPDPSGGVGGADCDKGEFMYDVILSEFIVPLSTGQVNVQVCNPAIYSVGMWWQFLNPKVILKVINIVGPIITLANRCDNGEVIAENPSAGTSVTNGSKFVVVGAPVCKTDADRLEEILRAFSDAEEICLPKLSETSATANSQFVGLVLNDPNDISQGKCLQRLRGIALRGTTPVFNALKTVAPTAIGTHRRLVKHNTTHEMVMMQNYAETPGLTATGQYFLGVNKNDGEKLVGPGYATRPFENPQLLLRNTASDDHLTWPTFSNNKTAVLDLGSIGAINTLQHLYDHFFAIIRLELGCSVNGSTLKAITARLNDDYACRAFGASSADYLAQFNSVTMMVKVPYNNRKINLKLEAEGTVRHYFAAYCDGVHF